MAAQPSATGRRRRLALARALAPLLLTAAPALARASVADDPTATIQLAATITSVWSPRTAEVATPFVVRRVANPRWRPPATSPLLPSAAPALRPGLLDHLSAQLYRSEPTSGPASSEWQFLAGQQSRTQDGLEMFGALRQTWSGTQLDALRLTGRRGIVSLGLGDQTPIVFGDWVSLQRMRGGVLRLETRETAWTTLGGVPTPVMGTPVAPIQVAGMSLDSGHQEAARYALTALGFRRDATAGRLAPDPAPGHGGLGVLGWRLPVGAGMLRGTLGGQVHDLDEGVRRLAIAQALAWDFSTRRVTASLASARNTSHAAIIGTDRFAPAPRAEDRWSLQTRTTGGRFETHSTGVIRDGGDPALETRTFALGFSGAFGRSAWYGGADAVWDRRLVFEERRYSVQAGRALVGGATMLARVESVERPNQPVTLSALGETSLPLAAGTRLELEPRLGIAEHSLQNGQLTARLSGPLGGPELRMTGTLSVAGQRESGFRGSMREVGIALSYTPRSRDRGDVEIRRLDEGGRPSLEYSARYETFLQRYEAPTAWLAARDTGVVTVLVGRSGNGSGMPDVLVSLDGQALRFTDPEGIARFDHVTPGIHTVAIEERSLESNTEVVGSSRVFVTVERGRVTEPVRFTIGRMERRTKF